MLRSFVLTSSFILAASFACAAQSTDSAAQSSSDAAKPAASSAAAPAAAQIPAPSQKNDAQDKNKKKPKKVWTNEEIGSVGGTISVVGDASPSTGDAQYAKTEKQSGGNSPKEQQIAAYRDQIHQLQAQRDAADKKISELRNFKADNTSPSGGINMKQGYAMTPIEDQIKQLEEKKKQIQARIDAVEDDARKNGIEPGQLR